MDVDQPTGQPSRIPSDSKPPDCSPPTRIDNNDRKLIASEFQSIQQLTAKFDLDACCDNRGENALVPYMYCSPNNSFLQHDCASQHQSINQKRKTSNANGQTNLGHKHKAPDHNHEATQPMVDLPHTS